MREIKFRAWTGITMLYGDDEDINFVTTDGFTKLHYRPLTALQGDSNNYTWMQYTGLKDKNGKKIYEGDIVIELDAENVQYIRTVKWNDSFGGWSLFNKNVLEVIGSVYENPELLTI